MLRWALIFFVMAVVAGILGFAGIAHGATTLAKTLSLIFSVAFLVFIGLGLYLERKIPAKL